MNPEEILSKLRRTPFAPFRICLSDGTSYDVRHPETVLVSRRLIAINLYTTDDELPERYIECSPLHVTRLEPLDVEPASAR